MWIGVFKYWIQCERLILEKEALFEFNSDRCSISSKSSLELLQILWTLLSWIYTFQENEAPGLFSKLVLPKLQNYISKKICIISLRKLCIFEEKQSKRFFLCYGTLAA